MQFTDEQLRAIEVRGSDVLVSAGAGSGKTAVLVERILRMVTEDGEGEEPLNIDRLLVLTFTDAAATQMRQRVGEALSKRIKLEPDDDNLRKQLTLLAKSNITTIHSFCLSVARRFFHKIGVDPSFRVADGAEIELMKADVLDEMFERQYREFYENGGDDGFVRLARIFDHGRGVRDDNFRRLVLDVYEFTRASADPSAWLENAAKMYDVQNIEDSVWFEEFVVYARRVLLAAVDGMDDAVSLASYEGMHEKYGVVLRQDLGNLRELADALEQDFEAFCEKVDFGFGSLVGARCAEGTESIREEIKEIRDECKKIVADLKGACVKSAEDMARDLRENYANVRVLSDAVNDFANRFAAAKREKNLADFSDFEHFCLAVLFDDEGELTDEAKELAGEFDEVFIDEYQDLSVIQEMILAAVAGKHRFMVGDVKQCIYQFRMARPEIFVEKYERYGELEIRNEELGIGELVLLAENFRSRDGVIKAVNWLFGRVMSEAVGGVEYDERARLKFAAEFEGDGGRDYRAVLHLVDGDDHPHLGSKTTADIPSLEGNLDDEELEEELTGAQMEGAAVARYVRGLFDEGFLVEEKNGVKRGIRYSDIVILLRSMGAAQIFAEELKNLDIPAFTGGDEDYFLAQEVMVMLALLSVIDNPRQDVPLLALLRSGIFRFGAEELMEVRACADGDFYGAMCVYGNEELGIRNEEFLHRKVCSFLARLETWRDAAGRMTVSELIMHLYSETGYYDIVATMAGGKIRRANLMMLFEKAADYERTSYRGLFSFIRYIERLQKNNYGFKKATVSNENDDVVRVMSIHKSKGLEFPVVFVCGLGKGFNMMDVRRDFMMDYDLGLGYKAVDLENRVASNTFARYVIGKAKAAAQVSEEMRILYVAMTRAKEKLYLVGTAKGLEKKMERSQRGLQVKPYDVMRGKNFLDWVLMANPWGDGEVWDVRFSNEELGIRNEEFLRANAQAVSLRASEQPAYAQGNLRDEVFRRLAYRYGYEAAIYAPAKMSVSEVKRLYYKEFLADSAEVFEAEEAVRRRAQKPKFLMKDGRIDAAGRGIVVHTVLEHVDVDCETRQEIEATLVRLVEKKILTQQEADIVPVESILRFLGSEVAVRMRKADVVRREMPFAVAVPPDMINSAFAGAVDGEEMVLHGVIDCVFKEDGQMVIVDYKTERVKGDLGEVALSYMAQMELYDYAVRKIFGGEVRERVIYFFDRDAWVGV